MVNATFEDRMRPDFDADANSAEFIAVIPDYVAHGVGAFTLHLQGGMPGYEGAVNSAFNADGSLRDSQMARMRRVIEACDRNGAVVILGCYYQRQDQILRDEDAVRAGVVNAVKWIQSAGFSNVVMEIANEFGHGGFNHRILKSPDGQVELIRLARRTAPALLVSTSGLGDGTSHESVARASDFLLIHFNATRLEDIPRRIASLKRYGKPILCNEDQKWGEQGAKAAELCVMNGASWGLMLEKLNQHFPFTFQGAADDPVVYTALAQLAGVGRAFVGQAGTGMAARSYEIRPAVVETEEEFEALANALQPGDELILHGGTYSQNGRRAVTVKGTADRPILIRAATGEVPLLTRPADKRDRQNNIEFVDCAHLVIRGLRFQGGSSGVRFIRGHHVTFEECEIFETGNNALTMNSGDCHAFVIRRNHIHHTGLSASGATEGEGMYIGCHTGSCRTTDSLIEGNYIHHLRSTSDGGNDGIEIKFGSHGNIVRNNVIHDPSIGRKYPGIFVYGGGPGPNVVEGNVIWNAGEGIQVVSDAIVRNNIVFNCAATGITAGPHAAVSRVRNATIINNTIFNAPVGVRMRWANATNMVFANNALYCPTGTALDASAGLALLRRNYVHGRLAGVAVDGTRLFDGGDPAAAFVDSSRQNFWPRPGSALIGRADSDLGPALDFNGTKRTAPFDVGAYETQGLAQNPGWTIEAGFKR
jgi:hypothetical protein